MMMITSLTSFAFNKHMLFLFCFRQFPPILNRKCILLGFISNTIAFVPPDKQSFKLAYTHVKLFVFWFEIISPVMKDVQKLFMLCFQNSGFELLGAFIWFSFQQLCCWLFENGVCSNFCITASQWIKQAPCHPSSLAS